MDSLSPEKAVEILKQHGTFVTLEEAKLILQFMARLADIEVSQFLLKQNKKKSTETNEALEDD